MESNDWPRPVRTGQIKNDTTESFHLYNITISISLSHCLVFVRLFIGFLIDYLHLSENLREYHSLNASCL